MGADAPHPGGVGLQTVLRQAEEGTPVSSLALYRAFSVVHVAGALLALIGIATSPAALQPGLRIPLGVLAGLQLVLGGIGARHPALLPRTMLVRPRLVFWVATAAAFATLGPVSSFVAATSNISFLAWVATAAAVGRPGWWLRYGLFFFVGLGLLWTFGGWWGATGEAETPIALGLAQAALAIWNATWLGDAGNRTAWGLRRWGLIQAHDAEAAARLDAATAEVRRAAASVDGALERAGDRTAVRGAVAQLMTAGGPPASGVPVVARLAELVGRLRTAYRVEVRGDERVRLEPQRLRVVEAALLRHLTNVRAHAPTATLVTVDVAGDGARATVLVDDDGGGAAPTASEEGEGTRLTRETVERLGGRVAYASQEAGVRLVVSLPTSGGGAEPSALGLGRDIRTYTEMALRFNRVETWWSFFWFNAFVIGTPWWVVAICLVIAAGIELLILREGSSERRGRTGPMLVIAGLTCAIAALVSFTTLGDALVFGAGAATTWPLVEIAWRRRWGIWAGAELARFALVLPWFLAAGLASSVQSILFPLVATSIVVGAGRLVRRAEQTEELVGTAAARRMRATEVSRYLALRHDVVKQLARPDASPEIVRAAQALDAALEHVRVAADDRVGLEQDVVDGLAAAVAPLPLRVRTDGVAGAAPGAEAASSSRDRVAALAAGASAGAAFSLMSPVSLDGGRRMTAVVAELRRRPTGEVVVQLSSEPPAAAPRATWILRGRTAVAAPVDGIPSGA